MGNDLCAGLARRRDRGHGRARARSQILNRRELAAVPEDDREPRRAGLEAEYEAELPVARRGAERGYVDDVIEPADTRAGRGRRPGRAWPPSGSACPPAATTTCPC